MVLFGLLAVGVAGVGVASHWLDTDSALSLAIVWAGMALLAAGFFWSLAQLLPAAVKVVRAWV